MPVPETRKSEPKREYRSRLRHDQAEATRRRVVLAAADCFADRGYAATTMTAIAGRADVSVETVNGHGPKRALLLAAFDVTFAGSEQGGLAGRDDAPDPTDVDDLPTFLASVARWVTATLPGGLGMWRALSAAAASDDGVAEAYEQLMHRRRAEVGGLMGALAGAGLLRVDRGFDELVDSGVMLTGFEPYQLFVGAYGWTDDRYADWLARTLVDVLAG